MLENSLFLCTIMFPVTWEFWKMCLRIQKLKFEIHKGIYGSWVCSKTTLKQVNQTNSNPSGGKECTGVNPSLPLTYVNVELIIYAWGFSSRCWATRQHLLQTLLLFRDGVWADAWERVWAFEGTDGSDMHRRLTPSAPIHRRPHPRDLSGHGKPHCQWLSSVVKKGHRGFFFQTRCVMTISFSSPSFPQIFERSLQPCTRFYVHKIFLGATYSLINNRMGRMSLKTGTSAVGAKVWVL